MDTAGPSESVYQTPSTSGCEQPAKKRKIENKFFLLDLTPKKLETMLEEADIEEDESDEEDEKDFEIIPLVKSRPGSPSPDVNFSHFCQVSLEEDFKHLPAHDPATSNPLDNKITFPTMPGPIPPTTPYSPPPLSSFTWDDDPSQIKPNFQFTRTKGLKIFPESQTPSGYFDLLFTDLFLNEIVQQTNIFAVEIFLKGHSPRSRITEWKEITISEFKTFLGIHFLMGVIQLPRNNLYWDTSYLFSLSFFPNYMSRDRFQIILQCLHFCTNPQQGEEKPDDPLYKIGLLINYFHDRMEEVHEPGKKISIDESMAPWRGRVYFRSYIPNKAQYGIKLYMLAEEDGLIHRFLIYAGAGDKEVGGQGHAKKIVHKLMEGLTFSGHSLFMDNFYNSGELTEELLQWNISGINVTGDLVNTRTKRGAEKKKPDVVCQYNEHKGGIDRADQLLSYYSGTRKSLKWYKKLGFHILELMLLNSYILYKRYRVSNDKVDLLAFRLAVVTHLCPPINKPPSAAPSSSTFINSQHFPTSFVREEGSRRKKQKRCTHCYALTKKDKSTTFYCPACPREPGLCIECFVPYHKANGFKII